MFDNISFELSAQNILDVANGTDETAKADVLATYFPNDVTVLEQINISKIKTLAVPGEVAENTRIAQATPVEAAGFYAAAYEDDNLGTVISYRGTDLQFGTDIAAHLMQGAV